jgi:vacuolar-type H+-ATPase catalytic subunit A/Vma1
LHEAVQVGVEGVLGEVIRIHGDEITAQVYEDTTGLSFGDRVTGDGHRLSVRLSPGLLGGIFDTLLEEFPQLGDPSTGPP